MSPKIEYGRAGSVETPELGVIAAGVRTADESERSAVELPRSRDLDGAGAAQLLAVPAADHGAGRSREYPVLLPAGGHPQGRGAQNGGDHLPRRHLQRGAGQRQNAAEGCGLRIVG